ncbi:RdgB/HAM1 family non-canonical purine NTP pyrophosphatase [bacterium]|nr:RdgB/HAM1 family non-canonical purine NTP pyrophosphatase [bacterium]
MLTKLKGAILLATNNPGKLLELQQLLAPLENVQLLTPKMLGIDLDVDETGSTYQENASLKAEAFAEVSGVLTLADDSGLEVDALDGAPGIHSKRYSPQPGASDADRRALMVANLQGKARPWTARFRACVALCVPNKGVQTVDGACEGEIIPEERGSNGFGYDPIFYIPALERTMAELTDEEKNAVSHRGNAVRAAIPLLVELLKDTK